MSIKPNYGIDAPGLVKTFFVTATVALMLLVAAIATNVPNSWLGLVVKSVLAVVGFYTLGMGAFMTNYSRNVKVHDREQLLSLLDFKTVRRVLDVGCGRGLMMVGAAKRTPHVSAVGIDLWLEQDQAENRPDAALENARLEGVRGQVEVQTADMRKLPFPNDSFDGVVSHWAVHNVEEPSGRKVACQEMYRVLRPGGALVLADISNHTEYAETLRQIGFMNVRIVGDNWKTALFSAISFGSFKPMAVYGEKAP